MPNTPLKFALALALAFLPSAAFAQKITFFSKPNHTDPITWKEYKTVKMPDGNVWMAENLNIEMGNSVCYDNMQANCKKCGRLYDWATANLACPSGWRLPSIEEWENLGAKIGESTAGTDLKSKNSLKSKSSLQLVNGVDKYGFSTLPCGSCDGNGKCTGDRVIAAFWSSTENEGAAFHQNFNALDSLLSNISIRCVEN